MTSAIACAADAVLFPEVHNTEDKEVETIVRAVKNARSRVGSKRVLIIKAEGCPTKIDRLKAAVDSRLLEELGDKPRRIETRGQYWDMLFAVVVPPRWIDSWPLGWHEWP